MCQVEMWLRYLNESEILLIEKKSLNKATSSGYEQHTILIRARIKPIIQGQEPKAD